MVGVFWVSITTSSVKHGHLVYSSSTHNNRPVHVWHSSMTAIRMERENVRIYLCKRAWLPISRVQFFPGGFGPPKAREKVPTQRFSKHSQALWEEESHIDQSPANWYSLCQVIGVIFATGARK